jgi:hypothetical protein
MHHVICPSYEYFYKVSLISWHKKDLILASYVKFALISSFIFFIFGSLPASTYFFYY